jgi:hypothetical protein
MTDLDDVLSQLKAEYNPDAHAEERVRSAVLHRAVVLGGATAVASLSSNAGAVSLKTAPALTFTKGLGLGSTLTKFIFGVGLAGGAAWLGVSGISSPGSSPPAVHLVVKAPPQVHPLQQKEGH